VKQGLDQDPQGHFVSAHVPELADVPDAFIHEPWRWPRTAALGYPAPIVDNAGAMREAREVLHGLRRAAGHGHAAREIAARHGSRRSGIPMTGRKTAPARKPASDGQLELDF
jgi:deoxyribodipyrimidine photo-lyase